ncbi:unnamed protein product [Symbiodinium sp. CCMP2456]|nr:unnamed protein product [Symbiodinium sp. CCMP2456]
MTPTRRATSAPLEWTSRSARWNRMPRPSSCRFGTQPARSDSERSRAATTEVGVGRCEQRSLRIADELLALPVPTAQALMASLWCMTPEAERMVPAQRSWSCVNMYVLQEPLLHMRKCCAQYFCPHSPGSLSAEGRLSMSVSYC